MILPVHALIRARMGETVARLYGLAADDAAIAEMALETPPKRELGDVAIPVAFALARRLRKAPRAIAQELADGLGHIDGVAKVEAAPNGYLNLFLDRARWLQSWLASAAPQTEPARIGELAVSAGTSTPGKVIVEHTAINPNKAAHIGHLRNAALGDAFGRLLRFQGRRGRNPELHRRYRGSGRRRGRRLPGTRRQDRRPSARHRRLDALRLLLLGPLRQSHRVVRS